MDNDLISRKAIRSVYDGLAGQRKVTVWSVREHIDRIQAEDAVKVVRCGLPKDNHCIHWKNGYCELLKVKMDPCDYCSYGSSANG